MPLKRRRHRWPRRWFALPILVLASLAAAAMVLTSDPGVRLGDQSPVAARPSAAAGAISARAIAIDGDTLKLGGERIRLHGIDAPEAQQRCDDGWPAGEEAKRALGGLVAAGATTCEKVTTDRYGRTVAICRVNSEDVAAAMVRRGLAWAYAKYSVRYVPEEALARLDRAGVHTRTCIQPAEWRSQQRR